MRRRMTSAALAVAVLTTGLIGLRITSAGALVPPGFDNGNQTSNPLTLRVANVNVSALPALPFSSSKITATDDVVGPHTAADPAALQAFHGLSDSNFGADAPDTQVGAGGGFVVEATNDALAIFDRTGAEQRAVKLPDLFSLAGVSDPKIVFDPQPGRWYLTLLDISGGIDAGDAVDIAVSQSADPTGLWDVYRLFTAASNRLADQPRLGFSGDKVLVDITDVDRLSFPSFCVPATSCEDDILVVIEKSDLVSLVSSPQAIDINMSTELNHRLAVTPAIPLPSAEVPNAFASYRGHDLLHTYASTLVIVGLPSTNDVAFKETGPVIADTGTPPPAAQPGVSPNIIDTGFDDRMLSVSLVSASVSDFSGVLWTASNTNCTPNGSSIDRACARIDKVVEDASGNATVPSGFDFNLGLNGSDIMYPAVVGADAAGTKVWVADSRSGPVFPTSELRLVDFGVTPPRVRTLSYGTGVAPLTTGVDPSHNNRSRFGDYSGIYVDPSESSGATVWAATENAAVSAGGSWTTSIVQATLLPPTVSLVVPGSGYAGDLVDIFGQSFSRDTIVHFGAAPSSLVTFLGSDHLQAFVPAQPPTTVNVFATTLKGTNTPLPGPPLPFPSVPDRFTYKFLLWASGTDTLGNVVAIDPTIDLRHFAVNTGTGPTTGIAMSRDSTTVYATSPTTKQLSWIDAASGTVSGTKAIGKQPTEIAVSADGTTAFITDPGAFSGVGGVIPVKLNTATGVPAALAPVKIPDPRGVATMPGGEVFVTSGSTRTVVGLTYSPCPIVKRWCPTASLPVPFGTPGPIASGPDRAWVGAVGDVGTPPGIVYSIDPTVPSLSAPLFMDRAPSAMTVSPDGHYAFAIARVPGVAIPVHHAPPAPDAVGPEMPLPDGPLGGGAVSFDSTRLYVAGGASGHINAAAVPVPYSGPLFSGPTVSVELASNLPPRTDCGGATWASPVSSRFLNEAPPTAGAIVTVNASILYCPPQSTAGGSATLDVLVHPPAICGKQFHESIPATLTAGVVSFSFQYQATCAGTWTAQPAILKYTGGGSLPPLFKATTVKVTA